MAARNNFPGRPGRPGQPRRQRTLSSKLRLNREALQAGENVARGLRCFYTITADSMEVGRPAALHHCVNLTLCHHSTQFITSLQIAPL